MSNMNNMNDEITLWVTTISYTLGGWDRSARVVDKTPGASKQRARERASKLRTQGATVNDIATVRKVTL